MITIFLEGTVRRCTSDFLRDTHQVDKLCDDIREQTQAVKVSLKNLLELQDDAHLILLDLLASVSDYCEFFVNKKSHRDLFDAVLACAVGHSDLLRFERGKMAALETAALLHGSGIEGACSRIAERLKELGVKGVRADRLMKEAKRIELRLRKNSANDTGDRSVRAIIEDAPVPDEVTVPLGWEMTAKGIRWCAEDEHERAVCSCPLIISRRLVECHADGEYLELSWHRDGRWHSRVIERAIVANVRDIVALAKYGLTVTSNNAKVLVQYLAEFEVANLDLLPRSIVSRRLGWQGDELTGGFLLGRQLFTAVDRVSDGVQFRGSDDGDDQIAAAFTVGGTLDGWISAVSRIADQPKVLLTFYASFVPPLLPILESPNFGVDLAGRTTTGKTTALRVAASVWGNPDEQKSSSILKTWDGTATWRERVPAILNNIPFILDDTKHAKHPDEVAKTIYSVAQGVGRGRGSVKGIAAQDTWQTVLLTSGEQPLTSFTEDGGTRPRVLQLWGSPFDSTSPDTGRLVAEVNEAVKRNFGHAGEMFIRYIVEHEQEWTAWKDEYTTELNKYRNWAEAAGNPFASRMAPYCAAIATAAWLAHSALELPWAYADPIEPLWRDLVREAEEANRGAAALRFIMDWAVSHQDEFSKTKGGSNKQPLGGWAGRWDRVPPVPGNPEAWTSIGIIPSRLTELLKTAGFEPESILRSWQQDGWLELSKDSDGTTRRTKKMRVGSQLVRTIVIKREAVEEVME